MAAGHFSQAGVFSQVLEQAERYAFLIWALSACPDSLGGASEEALVLDLILIFMVMGGVLAVAGELLPRHPNASAALRRCGTRRGKMVASSGVPLQRCCFSALPPDQPKVLPHLEKC